MAQKRIIEADEHYWSDQADRAKQDLARAREAYRRAIGLDVRATDRQARPVVGDEAGAGDPAAAPNDSSAVRPWPFPGAAS